MRLQKSIIDAGQLGMPF